MADILIKNMKMPENCLHCGFSHMASDCLKIWIICKPKDISVTDGDAVKEGRPDWCPLIEVPTPHGRLIDADEAISHPNMAEKNGRKLNPNYDKEWFRHCVTYARLIIETSPTIIEAEDGT